jgi:hypothetical protein
MAHDRQDRVAAGREDPVHVQFLGLDHHRRSLGRAGDPGAQGTGRDQGSQGCPEHQRAHQQICKTVPLAIPKR